MKALTLHRPWDWAMLHGKQIENRSWKPPAELVGQRFALHAGKHYDYDGLAFIKRTLGIGVVPTSDAGVVVGTTELVGWIELDSAGVRSKGVGPIASHAGCAHGFDSPWLFGPIGWVLKDTRALRKPVPCRGMQGLWTLPRDVERRVLEQLEAAA